MGYIGADPALNESVTAAQIVDGTIVAADVAANAITSSELADDAVDTAAIANDAVTDDAITLAKMAVGSDGALITYDTSGNPVAITGSDGQVATSSGSGAVSAFEAASGWVLLQSTTASDDSEVLMETGIDSTYNNYMVIGSKIQPATDGQIAYLRMKMNGSYRGAPTEAHYNFHAIQSSSGGTGYTATADYEASSIPVSSAVGNNATYGECLNFTMWLNAPSATDNTKHVYSHGCSNHSQETARQATTFGFYDGAEDNYDHILTACTGLKFYFGSGNISDGIFRLYGM